MRWFWALGEKSRCCAPDLEESWGLELRNFPYAPQEDFSLKLDQKLNKYMYEIIESTEQCSNVCSVLSFFVLV